MLSITILRTDTIYNPHRGRGKIRMMVLLHVKQNNTQLSKKCHPYNTRIGSGYISYERQFEWWDEQNRCTYYHNVKTTGAWYSQGKCCSRSQQRSSPGLRLRLTPLLVLIGRVWWVSHSFSHHFFCSSYMWQRTFYTPVVEVSGPRDICQAVLTAILLSGVLQQLFECLPQSSFYKKLKNVSCGYEAQLFKLRGTSDTFVGRAYSIFYL